MLWCGGVLILRGWAVCAIKHHWDPATKKSDVEVIIPIAKSAWEAKGVEGGLRVTLKGGEFEGREQKAVVEMRCNKTMTGLEGEVKGEEEYVKTGKKREEGKPETQVGEGVALVWDGYKREGDKDTLFLTWHTKYACKEAVPGETQPPPVAPGGDAGWGFFTWVVIL
jgi:hypothetical protein